MIPHRRVNSSAVADALFQANAINRTESKSHAFFGGLTVRNFGFGRNNRFSGASLIFNESYPSSIPVLLSAFAQSAMPNGLRVQSAVIPFSATRIPISGTFLVYGPLLLEYSIIFFAPLFAVSVITERERQQRWLLQLSGLTSSAYWLGSALSDWLIAMVPSLLIIAGGATAGFPGFRLCYGIPLIFLYALLASSNATVAYCISLLFSKEDVANRWLYTVYSFTTLIPFLIVTVLLKGQIVQWADILLNIFPGYGFSRSLGVLALESAQSPTSSCSAAFTRIYVPLLVMSAETVVLFLFLLAFERFQTWRRARAEFAEPPAAPAGEEEDIRDEQSRARSGHSLIRIVDLAKSFNGPSGEPMWAVGGVSLAIDEAEVLCLRTPSPAQHFASSHLTLSVGHNGAGKSTLLSMLSGQLAPSAGSAYLGPSEVGSPLEPIGVCMQQDLPLFDYLTGTEQLSLVGGIRAVASLHSEINRLVSIFGFERHISRRVSTYSDGTKRKLSVMCALLGSPRIIFLDEPSSGVSPFARRQLWNAIGAARARSGTSASSSPISLMMHLPVLAVLLTTHSMDEAEALADKVAILSSGRLRCVGSPMALKARFAKEYLVSIKMSVEAAPRLLSAVSARFPGAEASSNCSRVVVPQDVASLEELFEFFEDHRSTLNDAELQYTIAATLEQVFLALAREASL